MGPNMSTELSRLHQHELLREAEHERLVAAASAEMEPDLQTGEQRGPVALLMQLRNAFLPAHNATAEARWG